jgi:23S rRNA (uracil1939-C5)-methyltransferase
MTQTTTISSLGHKGEGIAHIEDKRVFVPFALPGETVSLTFEGERGTLSEVLKPSPERADPFCPYFGSCGGCQIQHLGPELYRAFKIGLVENPLRQAGLDASVSRFIDAAGAGRRRATLHARKDAAGYMRLRTHDLLDIEACPILVPALARAPDIARAIGAAIGECDVSFTASDAGVDVAVRNARKGIKGDKLIALAAKLPLTRLSFEGEMMFQRQVPNIAMGRAQVEIPIGSFLQATGAAEAALSDYVVTAVGKAKLVADLFCGMGPFALRIAEKTPVLAVDSDKPALLAMDKGARHAKGLKAITHRTRDLFRDPMTQFELNFDVVVLDPPRAGALAQVKEIALSKIKKVVMIACDPASFARDAAVLVKAGFTIRDLVAVDQFAWSNHIEVAATFER